MANAPQLIGIKDQANNTQNMAVHQDAAGNNTPQFTQDMAGASVFRASASFTPFATGAVTLLSIKGGSKTVRITKITLGGTSTASGSTLIQAIRTTALGSGGTAVNPTVSKMDPNAAAATAVVAHYTTAAQSAGTSTSIGPLISQTVGTGILAAPTTSGITQPFLLFPEGGYLSQAIVLRGTSDFLEIQNQNAGNLPTGTIYNYSVEWVEDNS